MIDQPQPPEVPIAQDRSLETLCHLLGLMILTPLPFGNVLAPLILWFLKRETNPGVDLHGKEAVNFQISMSIYTLLAGLSIFIGIGIVLLPAAILTNLVMIVIAAVKASKGELYRYPIAIRFIT
jgi:uncharacterized Tic20 family protein